MVIDTNKLVKPATFAKMKGKSYPWIYKQIRERKIIPIEIDGVYFINLEDDVKQ